MNTCFCRNAVRFGLSCCQAVAIPRHVDVRTRQPDLRAVAAIRAQPLVGWAVTNAWIVVRQDRAVGDVLERQAVVVHGSPVEIPVLNRLDGTDRYGHFYPVLCHGRLDDRIRS